jgi:hypothetical protein
VVAVVVDPMVLLVHQVVLAVAAEHQDLLLHLLEPEHQDKDLLVEMDLVHQVVDQETVVAVVVPAVRVLEHQLLHLLVV